MNKKTLFDAIDWIAFNDEPYIEDLKEIQSQIKRENRDEF